MRGMLRASFAASVVAVLCACGHSPHPIALAHLKAWEACRSHGASDDLITCDGQPFARVACLGASERKCLALTLTYLDGGRIAIYAAPGYDVDTAPSSMARDSWHSLSAALYPEVSPDAQLLWFKEGGLGKGQWRLYWVSDGSLRDVDPEMIWELRDLRYEGRSVRVAPPQAAAREANAR